mgnify:CR=1 FL=1
MKLSNCRVVRFSTQPAKNPRILPQMHSRSNPPSCTMRRNHRESEQTHRVPSQIQRRPRAHRHPHRRNRPAAPMSSKPQRRLRQHHLRHWQKIHHVSARTIYAPGQKQSSRRAYQRQRRRSKAVAPMSSEQRNPAQKSRLRGIIFIRSSRKSGLRMICQNVNRCLSAKGQIYQKTMVRCDPKLHQQNRPLFVM